MGLDATVLTLNELLNCDFDDDFKKFLQRDITHYSIPDYQREYKWDKARIKTFVNNVLDRSKFLGILTAEKSNQDCLYIVDGQQRLTTTVLLLAWLYNACAEEDERENQSEIMELMTYPVNNCRDFVLRNSSVGNFLKVVKNESGRTTIQLEISEDSDIYHQKEVFETAWKTINSVATEKWKKSDRTLQDYKECVLDCGVLLFVQSNDDKKQQGSIEEIYIDINEKSQRLDPEDIFKGHCFALCKTATTQEKVKTLWKSVKKQLYSMDRLLNKRDMSVFLHFYLLTKEACKAKPRDINKELKIAGEHIIPLEYKTSTKVVDLLGEIDRYLTNITAFRKNMIDCEFPDFKEVMSASANDIGNKERKALLQNMRTILNDLFSCKQDLFKLPMFYAIDKYSSMDASDKLSYEQWSAFVFLYNIYMFMFARMDVSKSRESLPKDLIRHIANNDDCINQFVRTIRDCYCKGDDNSSLEIKQGMLRGKNRDDETRRHLYQILDYFEAKEHIDKKTGETRLLFKMKLYPVSYNVEHLIISQSQGIAWKADPSNSESEKLYEFEKTDFAECKAWKADNCHWANYIWIDGEFNSKKLRNYDIVTKVHLLRGTLDKDEKPAKETMAKKHAHIEIICQHIMHTKGFNELVQAHNNQTSKDDVARYYMLFLNNYFSENSMEQLCQRFNGAFSDCLEKLFKCVDNNAF